MLRPTFPCSKWHYEMSEPCYPKVFAFMSHFLRAYWFSFTLVASFFDESFTWTWFCFHSSRHSFRYCVSTSLFMRRSRGRHLGISSSYHISISSSVHFRTTLWTCLGLSHLIVAHLSWCQCGHTIDDLCTHLLRCPCGSECIVAHDTFWDAIATIILENGTHV